MKTAFYLAAFAAVLTLSGCLTSEEPFYQDGDVRVDDRLVGTYGDEANPSQPTRLYISKVNEFDEYKGQYYLTVSESPSCSMKFGAVLFQVGTNRFLDMIPIIEACDHLPGNPPSLIELLQSAMLRPMHMVVKVDINTNGIRFSFADHVALLRTARSHAEFFQPLKPGQLPRMVPNTMRQRDFLQQFGGDTNVFKPGQFTRRVSDAVNPAERDNRPARPTNPELRKRAQAAQLIHGLKLFGSRVDGTLSYVDLTTAKAALTPPGDLTVQCIRSERNADKRFDWTFTLGVPGGGLIESTNEFMFLAPDGGYQPSFQISHRINGPDWTGQEKHKFFVKSQDGQHYARIQITIMPDYGQNAAYDLEWYLNPNGSPNLESAPDKTTKVQ
jgi:hypothetical protein